MAGCFWFLRQFLFTPDRSSVDQRKETIARNSGSSSRNVLLKIKQSATVIFALSTVPTALWTYTLWTCTGESLIFFNETERGHCVSSCEIGRGK